jgi:5'(3')-deoxyribonucleotidase
MRVLVDMDGVLYNWVRAYLVLYREWSGEELPAGFRYQRHFMDQLPNAKVKAAVESSHVLWTEGDAFPGSIEGLRILCSNHETYIATHPGPRPDIAVPGKVQWLTRFAPWFDLEHLICIKYKSLLRGDVLIEDWLRNLVSWQAVNPQGIALLMVRPWNVAESWFLSQSSGIGTVYDLADAAKFLDDLETREREMSGNLLLQKGVMP